METIKSINEDIQEANEKLKNLLDDPTPEDINQYILDQEKLGTPIEDEDALFEENGYCATCRGQGEQEITGSSSNFEVDIVDYQPCIKCFGTGIK